MQLTNDEEKALNGEYGQALATAYRILVAIGEATEAKKLLPVKWAHVSGVNYNTVGDSGVEFLEKLTGIENLMPDPYFFGGGLHQVARGRVGMLRMFCKCVTQRYLRHSYIFRN